MAKQRNQGFTLIELSIVLVIIGLIVGGVLVGQDLIKGAEIRATVSQLEKFNAATNTFRGKYNGLPGDFSNAARFGLAATAQAGTAGLGNGNGLLESSCSTLTGGGGETYVYWTHLAQANMIGDPTTSIVTYACTTGSDVAIGNTVLPAAKMGRGSRIALAATGGMNYFMLAGMTSSTDTTGDYTATNLNSLTPLESFQIDTKMDDGMAATGTVVSIRTAVPATAAGGNAGGGATYCYNSTTGNYETSTATLGGAQTCEVSVRASF